MITIVKLSKKNDVVVLFTCAAGDYSSVLFSVPVDG